jgi:DNA (cytosine-5)-methyltransferase 1
MSEPTLSANGTKAVDAAGEPDYSLYYGQRPENTRGDFTFVDLFAGIGGIRLGFEAAGGRCVFSSEWDRFAKQTYFANFGEEPEGDIRLIHAEDIPDFDVLLAGFPCQPFSIAGVSKKNALGMPHGFDCEKQGNLFFELERIIAARRPAAFLLENVKNLKTHDRGNTFKVIRWTLEQKLGYHIQDRILDARPWVPQHRERILIAGFRERTTFDIHRDIEVPPPSSWPVLSAVLHPEDGSEDADGRYTFGPFARVHDRYTLTDHLWRYLQDYAEKHRQRGNGFGYGLVGPGDIARTLSARYYKDGSEILVRRAQGNPRRLTPRECARLMGFDAPGRPQFEIPVSDTQAYRQFGNSVVVPVMSAIARAMRPHILDSIGVVPFRGAEVAAGVR